MQDKQTIRVTTYNTHFGRKLEKLTRAFLDNKNLRKSDVILLQEVEAFPKKGLLQAKKIAEGLGLDFYYAKARKIVRMGESGTHGLAVLSRYPITSIHVIPLPFFRLPLHSRKRIALVARIDLSGQRIYFCNIHLDARLSWKSRLVQLSGAVKYLKTLSPAPVILAGDFNTFPFRMVFKMLPLFYSNQLKRVHKFLNQQGFQHHTEFKGSTMRRGWIGMKVDHIYSTRLPIIKCGVEKTVTASDHKPVWADIVINDKN